MCNKSHKRIPMSISTLNPPSPITVAATARMTTTVSVFHMIWAAHRNYCCTRPTPSVYNIKYTVYFIYAKTINAWCLYRVFFYLQSKHIASIAKNKKYSTRISKRFFPHFSHRGTLFCTHKNRLSIRRRESTNVPPISLENDQIPDFILTENIEKLMKAKRIDFSLKHAHTQSLKLINR